MRHYLICCLFVLSSIELISCLGSPQESPQSIVETYAQCICDFDIDGAAACFEYGEETLGFVQGIVGDEADFGEFEYFANTARESKLTPEMSYEIIDEKIDGDKGVFRVRFYSEFDDGEEVHIETDDQDVPVYCHDGLWWIGEGLSNKDREMTRRMMDFFEKVR